MSDVSDELAEAERRFRSFLDEGCDCNHFPENEMGRVMAEYDRLRVVEKAAAALVDVIENKLWHIDGKLVGPLDTLKEALNGETT